MLNLPNIEKSAFRKGEYVGYSGGVWLIRKSNSSFGNWHATFRDDPRVPGIYAFTLKAMSDRLQTIWLERQGGEIHGANTQL